MKLDKRIKAITDIQSVTDGCRDWEFMTKKGYFANSIFDFKDLKRTCVYGEYAGWREHNQCFLCEFLSGDQAYFTYFLPEDSLLPEELEKKHRPYTVMEFIKEYPLGSHLRFRPKSKTMEMHRLIDGYNDCLNGSGTLFLCGAMFSMSELYDNYDIFKDGEWKPFGVLVEENE